MNVTASSTQLEQTPGRRMAEANWPRVNEDLDARGFAIIEGILTEQRPRMQSNVSAVPLRQGDAVVFPVRVRPARGARG